MRLPTATPHGLHRITLHKTKSNTSASTKVQEYDGRREKQERSCYVIRSSLAVRQDEIETQEALDNWADTGKLNKFKLVLSNKFQAFYDLLNGEETTMESNWKAIKEAITSTFHEVLGHKKHHHKEWITVDTLDKIQERNQIATQRIIVEQSIEWISSLYINFIDYEKAFDSVDRTTLWKLHRHYGVPQKIVNIIQNSYDGLHCKIVHGGQLTKSFEVKTGVRQRCLLSPSLFLLVIDWIMKTSTSEGKRGMQWTSRMQLDDLDFADDLALLSQTQQQMQLKTNSVAAASATVAFNIHKGKIKILQYNTVCTNPIKIDGEDLEDVKTSTYLGSITDEHDGSVGDVKARIGGARAVYLQLKNI
ncbi:unnamed protein product [Schistosoma margrebowiei]|uniref:Reverse transcriptase domain-containing protein n=1 Tax=Schistosoma margrebowiei TaxID=48269 RepID=A0A183N9H2_9TREM|nr:unnamed protein product [Schistosoma margrebowiei]